MVLVFLRALPVRVAALASRWRWEFASLEPLVG